MQPSASEKQAQRVEQELLDQIIRFFKLFGLVAGVWLIGYLGFSVTWLLVAVLAYVITSHIKAQRKARTKACQAVARDERQYLANLDSLPSWVFFPDVERAEWLNSIIKQAWPFVKDYAVALINNQILPGVKDNLPDMMKSFRFSRLDLGDIAPRIGGIKVYTGDSIRRSEIVIDVDLIYYGDANIELKWSGVKAGIKSVELRGTVRVVISPLIPRIPIAACVSVTFLSVPYLNFDLTNLGNVLDLPGLRQILVKVVTDQISALIVVPKRLVIPLVSDLDLSTMRWPLPQGVLRFEVVEARDLKRSDVALFSSGKSDPYAVVSVGSKKFTTKVIANSLNPIWNATFEAAVDVQQGQLMEIELFDEDPGSKDDPLGSAKVDLGSVASEGLLDTWLRLEDVDTGSVRLRLLWANLLDAAVFQSPSKRVGGSGAYSRAFLYVGVDSCRSLPTVKGGQEPSALVEVCIVGGGGGGGGSSGGGEPQRTAIVEESPNPIFESPFHFFVSEPSIESVQLTVLHRGQQRLGQLQIPLRYLLKETGMQLTRAWDLDTGSGARSQIILNLALRAIVEGKAQAPAEVPVQPKEPAVVEEPPVISSKAAATSAAAPAASSVPSDAPALATQDSPIGVRQRKTIASANNSELQQQSVSSMSAASTMSPGAVGRVQVTLRYSQTRQCLVIVCHRAELNQPTDNESIGDVYAKLYIESSNGKIVSKKQKTKTMKSTRQPVYDESFEFALDESELSNSSLWLLIQRPSPSKLIVSRSSRNVIGAVKISLMDFLQKQNATIWYDLGPYSAASADY